ncbi:FUN14 family domain-containing protein [Ditylenchus destructor]|nr:FUN14 family domain-containing protein [Ditylenchus destructor]
MSAKVPDTKNFPGKGRALDNKWSLSDAMDSFLRYLRNIQQKPVPVQIGIGAGTGVVTGYLFSKTSRFVALIAGCSIILFQFFNYRGYIKFNRSQFRRDLDDLQNTFEKELGIRDKSSFPSSKELDDFASKNIYLFGGYVAGSLIGYALS